MTDLDDGGIGRRRVKPRALDLYCKAGGITRGLQLAGFHVTGVDIEAQPNYCGDGFLQDDALSLPPEFLRRFDLIAASPPCQAYTLAGRIRNRKHPDLVGLTRTLLLEAGRPYAIENVSGAPLVNPIVLCGHMFGLRTYRHRIFECWGFPIEQPWHKPHSERQAKMGRPPKGDEFIQVVGNFSNVAAARKAMGIDWMTRDELREAIPPAYSHFIGNAALQFIKGKAAA